MPEGIPKFHSLARHGVPQWKRESEGFRATKQVSRLPQTLYRWVLIDYLEQSNCQCESVVPSALDPASVKFFSVGIFSISLLGLSVDFNKKIAMH